MASLKIISFNPNSPFNADEDYKKYVGKPVGEHQLGGLFVRDVDVIALQEPIWSLSTADRSTYKTWNVHEHYLVYGSGETCETKEVAVFVKKNSEWEVTSFYGKCYNSLVVGSLDINATILGYQEPPRRASISKRLVVVQLRHKTSLKKVTFVNYHGFNVRVTEEQNRVINENLMKSLLWMSGSNDGWPAVLAADFNPPAIEVVRETLETALLDRGCFYLPTMPDEDFVGIAKPTCIDGFFVVPSRKAVCISARPVELGAEILEPTMPSRLRLQGFDYILLDTADPPREKIHTHLAYKLDLLVATCGEVYGRFFPAQPFEQQVAIAMQTLQLNDETAAPAEE